MRVQRREFLRAGVAAGAITGLAGPTTLNALAKGGAAKPGRAGTRPGRWIPTVCQGCTTWCPVEVFVQNGRAVKVRGNRHSKQNDGVACPRAHLALQQLYDPDRVKVPMKRTNPAKGRGVDPKFVPITWDEALDTVADRILELRKNGEAHKYLLMRGRYTYMRDMLYDAMTKIIGSPNNISHSAICAEAEKFGSFFTEGMWGYRDYDIENTDYLLVWGCDPVSSNRMVPSAMRRFGALIDRGTLAVVDPKLQTSAIKAHEWLPVKPGEDGALACAIAHSLLVDGRWSREFVGDFKEGKNLFQAGSVIDEAAFVEKQTHGLVKWWNLELRDKTPEWAEPITGISARQIRRVARGLADAAPKAVVWLGPGACMHVRGAYTAMAVHAINGLLGSVDNVGGSLDSEKVPVLKMPKVDKYKDELAKKKYGKIDQRGTLEFPSLKKGKPGGGVVTNRVADAILDEDPYDIKLAIGYMNNFPFSCGGAQRWENALEKLPFYVHLTTHASEMTQYADIVLPSTMSMFEKWAWLKSKQNRHAFCGLMQPVVDPMWEIYTDETAIPWMIAERLAKKGFPNLLEYYRNELKDPETGKSATDAREFELFAVKWYTQQMWDGKKDVGGDRIDGWESFVERGMWNSKAYPYKKRWGKFKTKTKRFEFFSETLKASLTAHAEKHKKSIDEVLEICKYEARGEYAFIPHYESPYVLGDPKEYPFAFVDYKSRLNREGRSANSPWYMEFKKMDPGDKSWDDVLKINPGDATKLGIDEGDRVVVTSPTGSFVVTAKPWEGVGPGVVTKCFGQGHWAYGRVAADDYAKAKPRGINNNEIIPAEYDRLSGSTARNGGFARVRIEKAGGEQ
ncbi:MAG: molybdopterin-dependent oxidoreductase [Planctomycetota bacterium]|jgi:anaerobic selenocysteine-containing dehydrogenase